MIKEHFFKLPKFHNMFLTVDVSCEPSLVVFGSFDFRTQRENCHHNFVRCLPTNKVP